MNAARPHVNELIALELGPYRDSVDRFFGSRYWSREDARLTAEWLDWHDNQTLADTPPGPARLNALLWHAALKGYEVYLL